MTTEDMTVVPDTEMDRTTAFRLQHLYSKIQENRASAQEKDEYMRWLYHYGKITREQYEDYHSGRNSEDFLKVALIVGGFFLTYYVIKELINSR